MIYLYLCLCRAFVLVYLLCYGVYILCYGYVLLWLLFVLLVCCVLVFLVYGPCLRSDQGTITRSIILVMGFILP